jgi:hypothetical protein
LPANEQTSAPQNSGQNESNQKKILMQDKGGFGVSFGVRGGAKR